MRIGRFAFLLSLALLLVFAVVTLTAHVGLAAAKPSEKLVFKAKTGDITFLHAKHAQRLKGDCKACHAKLFREDTTTPLGYKAGMHKPAEKAKASCAACHVTGGTAFPSANNCKKCHVK
jgi:c(7)-type cytochrome triheme protein